MRILSSRTFIVVWAGVAAVLIWLVQGPLTGVDLVVRDGAGTTTVGPAAVVAVSLIAGAAGWALLALLERVTTRARTVWCAIAIAVLLVSFAGPLGAATTAQAKGALAAMHAVVGVILIAGLARSSRRQPSPSALSS